MAILNRFSAILLYFDSTHFLFLAAEFLKIRRFQACDSGNRAIRNVPLSSRMCLGASKNIGLCRT